MRPGIGPRQTPLPVLPDRLWTLMEIGVGGYILGRTAEKIRGAE
ncbi:MAG TPA: hypothetical protein VI728_04525 [Syntrophales bacterium]|nr:hypothetical protein [Syntrophales bacterium]